jgi:hypothetical protein
VYLLSSSTSVAKLDQGGRYSSIKWSLPCVSTWQRDFAVPRHTAKTSRHGKASVPCSSARQRSGTHGKVLGVHGKDPRHGKGSIIAHAPCLGRHPTLSFSLSSQPLAQLAPNPAAAAASQPSRRPAQLLAVLAPAPHPASRPRAEPGQPPQRCTRPAALAPASGRRCLDAALGLPSPVLARSTRPSCLPRKCPASM